MPAAEFNLQFGPQILLQGCLHFEKKKTIDSSSRHFFEFFFQIKSLSGAVLETKMLSNFVQIWIPLPAEQSLHQKNAIYCLKLSVWPKNAILGRKTSLFVCSPTSFRSTKYLFIFKKLTLKLLDLHGESSKWLFG